MKVNGLIRAPFRWTGANPGPALLPSFFAVRDVCGGYLERTRWYPKDGDLCLAWMKPEETLVEVRSDSDVQIDRQS